MREFTTRCCCAARRDTRYSRQLHRHARVQGKSTEPSDPGEGLRPAGLHARTSHVFTDSLLTALEVLRQLYASGERKLGFGSVKLRLAFEERADCSRCPPSIPERYKPAPYISRWPPECTCAFFPASFVRSSSIHRSLICDGCAIEKGYDQA